MSLVGPPPASLNPVDVILNDLRLERRATVPFPPGPTNFSMARTNRMVNDPVPMLVEGYQRYGPVFTMRILHQNSVFMIGPEANHYVLVSHASNFSWRDGHFRELIPFMGDGLLTIDGDFHRRSRQIMLPAFHHKQIANSTDVILEESERALALWHIDAGLDLYDWTRRLALRVAMRAIFGLDPDGEVARRARRRAPVHGGARVLLQAAADARRARARHAVREDAARPAGSWTASSTPRSPGDGAPASAGWTCSACSSTPRTRTATRSTTCTSATR